MRKEALHADFLEVAFAVPASRALCVQDRAQLSLEQQLKVIALRHDLLAKMDEILQDRKRMIATLQVCSWPPVQIRCNNVLPLGLGVCIALGAMSLTGGPPFNDAAVLW